MAKTINIGIIGFGTVGSGTVKILLQNAELIKKRTGIDFKLKKIADLDLEKDRNIKIPRDMLTTDAYEIINDTEIDIVIELIGGISPAKDFIIQSFRNKKHVITANKALIATHGNEIFLEAEKNKVFFGFEASVAGGIPIIKTLKEGLVANHILAIYGIINGTSNYILTKMTNEKVDFTQALKEAQRLGYAEADPTLDVEGIDSAHKLTILSALSFGIPFLYDKVYKEGITKMTSMDIEFALELGYKIKLLAIAKATNGEIEMRVHPTMVPNDYLISKVDGVYNAIYVEGDSVGSTLYYGKGAGDMPTGSAVVADIVEIGKIITGGDSLKIRPWKLNYENSKFKIKEMEEVESKYYFRFSALDKPGVLSKISGILGNYNISIASVIQKGRRKGGSVPVVILTHLATERNVLKALKEIDELPVVSDKTLFIRVEGREE